MLAKIRERSGSRKASPAAVGIATVLLMVFISWQAYINLLAPTRYPLSQEARANRSALAALEKRCNGNFGQLSAEDQAMAPSPMWRKSVVWP